jgi:hypothetical protein
VGWPFRSLAESEGGARSALNRGTEGLRLGPETRNQDVDETFSGPLTIGSQAYIRNPGVARTEFRHRSVRGAATLEACDVSPCRMVNWVIADTTRPSPGDPTKMVEAMIAGVDREPAPRRIARMNELGQRLLGSNHIGRLGEFVRPSVDDRVAIDVLSLSSCFDATRMWRRTEAGELGEEALDEVTPGTVVGVKVNAKRPADWVASQAWVSLEICAEWLSRISLIAVPAR